MQSAQAILIKQGQSATCPYLGERYGLEYEQIVGMLMRAYLLGSKVSVRRAYALKVEINSLRYNFCHGSSHSQHSWQVGNAAVMTRVMADGQAEQQLCSAHCSSQLRQQPMDQSAVTAASLGVSNHCAITCQWPRVSSSTSIELPTVWSPEGLPVVPYPAAVLCILQSRPATLVPTAAVCLDRAVVAGKHA